MDNVLTKRVSLIELFYDLVFVYMISRATSLIHHLQYGIVSLVTLAIFALVVVALIQPTFAVFTTTAAIVPLLNAAVLTSHMLKHN